MNLGVDARLYGLEHAGIGRYILNLVDRLVKRPDISLTLFISPQYSRHFVRYSHVKVIPTTIRHYSLQEQIAFLALLNRYQFDLFHVPHFNVPYFYHRPFVVTIHDILWHQVRGSSVTTLPPWKYYLKYLGYRLTVNHAINHSSSIFVPSNYVKKDLLNTFPNLNAAKIHVTYEGVSLAPSKTITSCPQPYLVYVGSAYPHKNLSVVLQALKFLDLKLKIIGSRSIFLDQVKRQARQLGVIHKIDFLGPQSDAALAQILSQATALVHPSKSEGFGLTGLEAMAAACPVIAANTTALPEIYGQAALFFDPDNVEQLVSHIQKLAHNQKLRNQLIDSGLRQIKNYSWDKMVDDTISVYRNHL